MPKLIICAVAALLLGLGLRGWLVSRPPSSSTLWDHHEYVRWGVLMHEEGLTALYDHPPRESLMWNRQAGAAGYGRHPHHFIRRVCNYPPLAAYVLYAEMSVLRHFDPSLTSNTPTARLIYALPSILCDVLLALGCWAVLRRYGPPWLGAVAFAVVMLAPPFFIDSAWWTQTDSWVLAPLVWVLWAMLSRRRFAAGVCWGVALGLKTQAILFAPVWLFALLRGPDRRKIVLGGVLAVCVPVISSVPFMCHSGAKWFEESYTDNLLQMYKLTTLKAFNVWYLDLLHCDDPDAGRKLLGLEKDTWGKGLLGLMLLATFVLLLRRPRGYPAPLLFFTAAALLAMVIFPTRVHERYIILPLPFLIMAAMLRRRLWIPLVVFLVVASVQMTSLAWLGRSRGAGSWADWLEANRARHLENLTGEYTTAREILPPEEFAKLLPPERFLEQECRKQYAEFRAEVAPKEWVLTLTELGSATLLFVFLLWPAKLQPQPPTEARSPHDVLTV